MLAPSDQRQALTDLSRASDNGFISLDEYIEGVAQLTGRNTEEIGDIIRQREIRNPEMLAYVKQVRKSYRTAMLSNIGHGVIERLFSADELNELFDAVVLSSEIGMTKPNVEAYEYTAAKLDLVPDECIMIDDTPLNAESAEMAGMHGVVFKDIAGCKQDIGNLVREKYARTA